MSRGEMVATVLVCALCVAAFLVMLFVERQYGSSREVHWSYIQPDTLQFVRDFPDCKVRP